MAGKLVGPKVHTCRHDSLLVKRPLAIALWAGFVALLFFALASWIGTPFVGGGPGGGAIAEPAMVELDGAAGRFWPYLSPREAFEPRSPINVVMLGTDLEEALGILRGTGWTDVRPDAVDAHGGTYGLRNPEENASVEPIAERPRTLWRETVGADRLAYLHDGQQGRWVKQDAHVHDGTYFGHRVHVRLYESPVDGEWVVMQAHAEHFDWFTLRHQVEGVAGAQEEVEAGLMANPAISRVWRLFLDNGGPSDSDGWATVVELNDNATSANREGTGEETGSTVALSSILLVAAVAAGHVARAERSTGRDAFWRRHLTPEDQEVLRQLRQRLTGGHLALAASIVAIVLGVRWMGILLEGQATALPMRAIAAIGYPILIVGLPAAAYGFSTRIEHRLDAAVVASMALAIASLLDYGFLGVVGLPLQSIVHRAVLVGALGLVAAGAARAATRTRRLNALAIVGILAWFTLVVLTLVG